MRAVVHVADPASVVQHRVNKPAGKLGQLVSSYETLTDTSLVGDYNRPVAALGEKS
jgi:hypothetical protein